MILSKISKISAKAADIYPQVIRLMDAAAIPPDERA